MIRKLESSNTASLCLFEVRIQRAVASTALFVRLDAAFRGAPARPS